MNRTLLCTGLLLTLSAGLLVAQELPYSFSVLSAPYNDLTDPISINDNTTWDDPDWEVSIGFDFVYMDQTFNSIYWGGVDSYGGEILFGASDGGPVWQHIMPYMVDLMDGGYDSDGASDSPVSYQLEGEPGSRIFKVEWKNCAFYNDEEASTMRMNFQMWLYEGSNNIEFRYGPRENLNNAVIQDYYGIPVGMSKDYNWIDYTFNPLWTFTGDPQNPSVQSHLNYDEFDASEFLTDTPADGTVYHFSTTPASVSETQLEADIEVYPTLVNGGVNIRWSEEAPVLWVLTDVSGRQMSEGSSSEKHVRIDVADLAPGWYTLAIEQEGVTITRRFIKQ